MALSKALGNKKSFKNNWYNY